MIRLIETETIGSCQTRITDIEMNKIMNKSFSDLFPDEYKFVEFDFSEIINEPNGVAIYYKFLFNGKWVSGSHIMIAGRPIDYNSIKNLLFKTLTSRGYGYSEAHEKIVKVLGD